MAFLFLLYVLNERGPISQAKNIELTWYRRYIDKDKDKYKLI